MRKFILAVLLNLLFIGTASAQINIVSYGAIADGTTDNIVAINNAIAAAKNSGDSVFIPAGTFAYSNVIKLDGVKMAGTGDGSVLYALNWSRQSIIVYGNNGGVSHLKLIGVKAPSRQRANDGNHITMIGATNFVIDDVTIDGSATAGILSGKKSSNGKIINNRISNTMSDSIHMTEGSSFIVVENNHIENSGDDGIAVVSYRSNGDLVNNIIARNNVILNNKWGRLMSVVGGRNVLYENNYLENNLVDNACVYIAQEWSYKTYGAHDVMVRNNTLKNCGGRPNGQGAILVFSSGEDTNTNISVVRNDLYLSGQKGIRAYSKYNFDIVVDSNRITGARVDYDLTSPNVKLIPYSGGAVGYVKPVVTPPAPPAVPVSVAAASPLQSTVQAGKSFDLTYTFSGGPTKGAQEVFVHFLNEKGEIAFQDDHVPPVATTNWKTKLSYERTITVPAGTAAGSYRIVTGLYDTATRVRTVLPHGPDVQEAGERRYQIGVLQVVKPATGPVRVMPVTPTRTWTHHGQPFNLQYNFSGGPTEKSLMVFVHFVDEKGNIVLQDDHLPPIATNAWNGKVSYTRKILTPDNMQNRVYAIAVGLYDPKTGKRYPLGQRIENETVDLRRVVGLLIVK